MTPSTTQARGSRPAPAINPDGDPLTTRARAVWTAGDFEYIAASYRTDAAAFVARLGLRPGERVLDVACGTGNLTLPAARAGARVTGLDIAPNLLATAAARAAREGLTVQLDEGNAEELPYADGAFDTVISMFGAMFAPRPDRVTAELMRVVRPGGRIVMANWTPGCFIGDMFRAHAALVPPPAGVPSSLLWGDESTLRERFQGAARVTLTPRTIALEFDVPPAGVTELFRRWYGPTVRTYEALDAEGQASLTRALTTLWTGQNQSLTGGTRAESEYMEVVVER